MLMYSMYVCTSECCPVTDIDAKCTSGVESHGTCTNCNFSNSITSDLLVHALSDFNVYCTVLSGSD